MATKSRAISKVSAVIILVVIVIGGAAAYFVVLPSVSPKANLNVTMQTDFSYNGYHTPFFVAADLGYYNQTNLNVKIEPGSGSATTIQNVESDTIQFGLADVPTALTGIANSGGKATLIGVFMPLTNLCYASIQSYGISSPADFTGKRWGGPPADAGWVLLPLFGKVAGFNASAVTLVNMAPSLRITSLIEHKIDFMTGYDGGALQAVEVAVEKQGLTPTTICVRDYGVTMFGQGIWVNDNFLQAHPDAVAGFVKATYEGLAYTMQHPVQAANIFLKHNPALDNQTEILQVERLPALLNTPDQHSNYLGYMSPTTWSDTVNSVYTYLGAKSGTLSDNLYTNQFVQQAGITYPSGVTVTNST